MLFKTGKFVISALVIGFFVALATFAQRRVPIIEPIEPEAAQAQVDAVRRTSSAQFQLTRYIEPSGTDQLSIECDDGQRDAKKGRCLVIRRSNGATVATQPIARQEVKGLLSAFFKQVPSDAKEVDTSVSGTRKLASYEIRDDKKFLKGSVSDSILDEKTGQPSLAQVKVIDSVLSIEGKLLSRLEQSKQ
ncbi:MAG: hypothetical protein H7222_14880 [Methylotenera sp.]|nr:hypothetical protein [Oligoflexia bacterium]